MVKFGTVLKNIAHIFSEIISKMRTLVFGFLFLTSSLLQADENVKTFVQGLDLPQQKLLDRFFRILVKDSFSGYVLYGDKPISIEAYSLSLDTGALTGSSDEEPVLIKGLELWQDFNLSVTDKNYFFLTLNDHGYRHFLCINRKAFIQAVNDNLTLFQYVLGPTLTAESLLDELIRKKDQFYQVLKNDNVLLGVLLGYGKQNALLISREECLSDAFASDQIEDFPLISRKDRMQKHVLPNIQLKRPSIGNWSLAEEIEAIKKRAVVSRSLRPFDSYKIPYFGCEPESEETKALLSIYEKNREEIIKVFESDHFLEKTLNKLFTTTSKILDIPKIPKQKAIKLPANKEELLAGIVLQEIRQGKYFKEDYLVDFMKGFIGGKQNHNSSEPLENTLEQLWEEYHLEKNLERTENLQKSNAYFKKIASQKSLIPLIPSRLYYKIVQKGKGIPSSIKLKNASFNFTYQVQWESEIHLGSINKENIEHFIPGIGRALIGMKRGEQREVHIHPEYGYGEDSYLPPNLTIIAKVELVEFEDGDREAVISQIKKSEEKNYNELLSNFEKSIRKKLLANGIAFRKYYNNVIDYQVFQNHFNKAPQNQISIENQNEFLINLNLLAIGEDGKSGENGHNSALGKGGDGENGKDVD